MRHATTTDYSSFGIPRQHPAIVKGKAGPEFIIMIPSSLKKINSIRTQLNYLTKTTKFK